MSNNIKYLYDINRLTMNFFIEEYQKNKKAQEYVESRLSKQVIQKFGIGYAPNGGLYKYLKDKDININDCNYLGLLDIDINIQEFFIDRIIIPIPFYDKIAGFCGRTFIDSEIKYINSKTSIIFNKNKLLYPLDRIYKFIVHQGYVILVEGYFDVLALISHGIYNVVSLCGTSLSENQIRLLQRWTKKVYICFDGDEAGINQAKKAKNQLIKHDMYGGTIQLDCDPDEYVSTNGKIKFLEFLN